MVKRFELKSEDELESMNSILIGQYWDSFQKWSFRVEADIERMYMNAYDKEMELKRLEEENK